MAGCIVTGFKRDSRKPTVLVTLVTFHLEMFIRQGIFCLRVVGLFIFPTIGSVALLTFGFPFVDIFMACKALFILLNPVSIFYMAFITLDLNVLPCQRILGISIMVKLSDILPSLDVVATFTIPPQLVLMDIFMTGYTLC